MANLLYIGLTIVLALITYVLAYPFVLNLRRNRKGRQLGCQNAPLYPSDPLGISLIREMLRADKEMRMPDFQIYRVERMSQQEGRFVTTYETHNAGGKAAIFTVEPKNIQTALATKFKDYEISENRIKNFEPLLGTGIFSANGARWEHSRALLRPQFVRDQVAEAACDERHVANMLQALPAAPGCWTDLTDVHTLFVRLTLDSATEFLFGESVDSQLAALPGYDKSPMKSERERDFAAAWEKGQGYLSKATRLGDLWWLAHNSEFKEMCRRVHNFAEYYVQRALRQPLGGADDNEKGGNYVFLEALAAETRDPYELRVQLLNILLAGRDTTASLLSWLFRLLATHPEVFRRLRDKVLQDFGTFEHPKDISFVTLKNCAYLQWVLNETLRLFPSVPLNVREAAKDTVLPTGGGPDGTAPIFAPKGTEFAYSVHVMHRRKDLWGPDADEFKPERWENRRPGWEYLPFNGGPRICIGQQFALTKAGYVTVRLLQRFDEIDGIALSKEIKHGLTLINSPGDGVNLRLKAAKAN